MAPLKGIKVIEMCGLAPAPFLGLILSDFGAKVIRIDNLNASNGEMFAQQKETMYLNLKNPKGKEILQRLSSKSDVLIDPFRPGVMERLDLGPEKLCKQNERLIYTRLSGYGQNGRMSQKASHDINFLALSGVMSRLGYSDRPPIAPMNLLGDIGGGSILCALAVVMAIHERTTSGLGQIIDHSMTEGTGYVGSFLWESLKIHSQFLWPNWPKRGQNLLDYGAPFYRCYECSDGKFLAVGSLEEKFYLQFIKTLGFDEERFNRYDTSLWPQMAQEFARVIKQKPRDEWVRLFEDADACVTPVLDMDEVSKYGHNQDRQSFDTDTGYPNPAPRLSRTPAVGRRKDFHKNVGKIEPQTKTILKDCGYTDQEIENLGPDVID